MGFYRFDEHRRLINPAGKPVHVVGVNYVAKYVCTDFWADWRPAEIEQDLREIHELGLTAVRIPMQWCSMEPEEGRYSADFERKFDAFLALCKKYDIAVMPWFLAGVATRFYEIPFRAGRSVFSEDMTVAAENLFRHFMARYKDEESILFWDICDEPEYYADLPGNDPRPYNRQMFTNWVRRMYNAIRSVDPNHLITLGFGGIANSHFGMDIRDCAEILDFMAITCYPGVVDEPIDAARNNYALPYALKMNNRSNPLFSCESPGSSSVWVGEELVGRYYNVSLYSNFLNGSTGALPWAYNDFDESLVLSEPLEANMAEPWYGIKTTDGRLKPCGQALKAFAAFADKADFGRYCPLRPEAAVVIPEGYYSPKIKDSFYKTIVSMALSKGAGFDVDFVWTSEDFSAYKLLILPTNIGMTTSQWKKLRDFVADGGTLYFWYEGFKTCSIYFDELCGVRMESNNANYKYDSVVAARDWGVWHKGEEVVLHNNRPWFMGLKPNGAEVIFTFTDGTPALLRNRYGKGTCFYAVENFDSNVLFTEYTEYLSNPSFELYRTIAEEAGIRPLVRVGNTAVETGVLTDPDTGDMLVVSVNHDNRPVDAAMTVDPSLFSNGRIMRRVDSDEVVTSANGTVHFDADEALVYRITPAE